MKKFLQSYPFTDPKILLVEGFSAYDGVLGDQIGAPHKGIDYTLKIDDTCIPFEVHAMHDGIAFQGKSASWGTFVIIHTGSAKGIRLSTIYAHLDSLAISIASQYIEQDDQKIRNPQGTLIHAGQKIGRSGTTGWTNGINQLHVEVHLKNEATNETVKLDPYGLNDQASSNRYPQPGSSLTGLDHMWLTDLPPMAS